MEAAVANALTGQLRYISYPDYKTKDDFPTKITKGGAQVANPGKNKYVDFAQGCEARMKKTKISAAAYSSTS